MRSGAHWTETFRINTSTPELALAGYQRIADEAA